MRGPQIFEICTGDDIATLAGVERPGDVDAGKGQHVGASAFKEAQEIGVIDDAAGVRVLIIDAYRKAVFTIDESASVGPIRLGRLHSQRP